jgi:long-chain acyl-CoA synthetase
VFPKSPVLLFLENSADFAVIFLALVNIEAVPVPVKIEYRRMELIEIFQNVRPHAVVCESYHLPVIQQFCEGSTTITRRREGFTLQRHIEKPSTPLEIDKEIVSINYTYRGYGYPLGALLPERQYVHGARVVQDELGGRPGDTMMILLPLSHIFPMVCGLFLCLLYRFTALIAHTLHPRLIFEYIGLYRVNYMTAVPEIYDMLWRCRQMATDLSSLKLLFSGGSCLADKLYHSIRKDFGVYLAHGYGLTEFTPISRNSANHNRAGTVGPICDGIQVKISPAASDGSGEILFKSEGMARGYLRRPAETRDAFCDGWFRTGDIGRIDRGHLVFLREQKNTRKVNGNMVDLVEVERALLTIPGIHQATVVHERGTLSVNIGRSSRRTPIPHATELMRHMADIIARYKIPKRITFV